MSDDIEKLAGVIQPECDHIITQFVARKIGDNLQILAIATLAATLPTAMSQVKDLPREVESFVESALTIALEERGFLVVKRGADH